MDFASLQHSVFLQSLGSAILNSLWQGFMLWFLYETISVYYKAASARFKNNLGTLLLFLSFVWFTITFISKLMIRQAIIGSDITPALHHAETTSQSTPALQQFLTYAGSSMPYLSIAYIFLLFFLMAKLLAAYRHVYIISNKRLINPPAALNSFTLKVATQMKIPRKIKVWISNHIDVPATVGFLKPVILIPFASLNNLSGSQLEAIILHELSHIKRNDYIINIIISAIETILFFNPFVALLSIVIKRERENCCDDFVLQYQYDPHSYALALLRLEQSRTGNIKLAMGAVSGKKQLLSRIKRITNGQAVNKTFNYGQKLLALLFITVIFCSIAWLSPNEKNHINTNVAIKLATQGKIQKDISYTKAPKQLVDQKENLSGKSLKEVLVRKGKVSISDPGQPSPFMQAEDLNFGNAESSGSQQLPSPEPFNLKKAQFFFDPVKIKLPASINIKDFPFQNMALNIDLSKIDLGKLNENLKKAYNEIDAVDWTKISNEIGESLSKIKTNDFPSEQRIQQYLEKAEIFSKRKLQSQKYNLDILKEKVQEQMKRFSINKARIAKIESESVKGITSYAENTNINHYPVTNAYPGGNDNASANNAVQVVGYKSLLTQDKKVVITINHTSNTTLKRILQLSFNTDSDMPESKKVTSVEVNYTP